MSWTTLRAMLDAGVLTFPSIDTRPLAINLVAGEIECLTDEEREQLYEEGEAGGMSDYTRIREQFPGDAVRVYGQPCGLKICVTRTLADAAQITVPYLVTYNEMGDDARMQVVCARIRLMVDHEARYYEAGGMSLRNEMWPPIDTNPLAINRIGGAEPALTEEEREQLYEEEEAERGARRILSFHAVAKGSLEVDYARDLDDAPTFTEALAALEAHKARRWAV